MARGRKAKERKVEKVVKAEVVEEKKAWIDTPAFKEPDGSVAPVFGGKK